MTRTVIISRFFGAFTAAVLAFGHTNANAGSETINCPLKQAKTEVTSPLPSGWWQTPQITSLKNTSVKTLGGKTTLFCWYPTYGNGLASIQRVAPKGKKCTAQQGGFRCDDPPAAVHSKGKLTIQQTYLADLDDGKVSGPRSKYDIWFEAKTKTKRFITPYNSAKIALGGNPPIRKEDCANRPMSANPIPIEKAPVGSYVCVKTNEGRISVFRVNKKVGASPGVLEIGFTTWE